MCAREKKIPLPAGFLNLNEFGAITVPCRQWTVLLPRPPIGLCGEWCSVRPPWHGLDSILDDGNGCIESRRRRTGGARQR